MTYARRAVAAVATCAVLGLSACSSDAPDDEPSTDPSWQSFTVGPVTLSAPSEWERSAGSDLYPSSDTDTTVALTAPENDEGVRAGVLVTVQSAPTRDATEEAAALMIGEKATTGADDVETGEGELSGASSVATVSFVSDVRRSDGTTASLRSRWIVADLDSGEQVIVRAVGPRDEFEDTPLDEILQTVTLPT
ncbi:hypothetical protein [Cellulomonas sp. URHE0023]|uniref:hypothetical protein n=1 Tax=Cellulomonas sp. URHE0023 TaxID=1380354 RepID=UPI000482F5FE|nr:hypothetical protein [Cellulomonas sp. URHE0023]